MIVAFGLINAQPVYQKPAVFFFANALGLCAEVAILFSIHALTRKVQVRKFILLMLLSTGYCGLMEISRIYIDPNLPTLLYSLASLALALSTYAAYKSSLKSEIGKNLFLKWIGAIEIFLAILALVRVSSYFMGAPIKPHEPTILIAIFYALYVFLCISRYVAYQSLRISWVDPRAPQPNILNKNLAKVIKEKDRLLNDLISSNRAIGISSLASSLAHQLSQPLTSIGIQIEIIQRDLLESNQNQNLIQPLNKTLEQVEKLSDLVKNLRHLFQSRNEQFGPVDLEKLTLEILELIEPTLKSKKITLTKSIESNLVVDGDKIQLQQVLINLFNNAIDAIAENRSSGNEIKITITCNDQFAKLSIEDSGTGIKHELLPKLFDLYRTTKKDGLGVGLWLSKIIIDKHHGNITATNGVNGGAIFEIQIPLAREKGINS